MSDLIEKIQHEKFRMTLSVSITTPIVIFSLINFVPLLEINNDGEFEEVAFVVRYLEENKNTNILIISTHESMDPKV